MMRRQLAVFLVVGSLTALVDFLTYRGLVWTTGMGTEVAKAVGFLAGSVFSYFSNRAWTFGQASHAGGSSWRFALLYASTLGANVLVNEALLRLLGKHAPFMLVAFVTATGVSASLNFIGMKWFVFKPATVSESA